MFLCSIVGISKCCDESLVFCMLDSVRHRGPDGFGVYSGGCVYHNCRDVDLGSAGGFVMAHNLLSVVGDCEVQPFVSGCLALVSNAELYNYKELADRFCLDDKLTTGSDCEVILRVIENFYDGDLYEAVVGCVDLFDGDYAFCITDGVDYIVMRDYPGVKPLYYSYDGGVMSFASEEKALRSIGLTGICDLNPGYMIYNDEIVKFRADRRRGDFYTDYSLACRDLEHALAGAVRKRVNDLENVAVLFSAGVDSSIIVKLLQREDVEVTLYTVGTANSQDLKAATRAADCMGLDLHKRVIDVEVIEEELQGTIDSIESYNLMKIGVGMTMKLTSKLAALDGHKVILSGQGADELFAGYNRYKNSYNTPGMLYGQLDDDLENIHRVNLERDDKAVMSNSVELRVPYLDKQVIKTAGRMPMDYLLKSDEDNMRKHVLRDVALNIGVDKSIALRPKKAAQYATGIDKILRKKILKKEEFKDIRGKVNR